MRNLIGVLFFCFALPGLGHAEDCRKISDPEAQKRCIEENWCVMNCHFDIGGYKFTDKTSTACPGCNKYNNAKLRAKKDYCAKNCGTPEAYEFEASWGRSKPTCRESGCPDPGRKTEEKPARRPADKAPEGEGFFCRKAREQGWTSIQGACGQERENKNTEKQLEQAKGRGEDAGSKIKDTLEPAKRKWEELLSKARSAGDESTARQAEQQIRQIEQNMKAGMQSWQKAWPAITQGINGLVKDLNQGIEDFRKTGVAGSVTRGSPEAKISNPKCGKQALGKISDPKCAQIQEGTAIEVGKGQNAGFSSPAVGNTDVRGEGKGAEVRYEDCQRGKKFGCTEVLDPGEGGITVRKQFPDPENDYKPKGLTKRDVEEFNKSAGLDAQEHALRVKFDGADPKQNKNLQLVPGVGQLCPFCGGVPYIESDTPQILKPGRQGPSKPKSLKINPPPMPKKRPSEEGDPEFVTFVAADKVTTIVVLKGSITFFPEMKKKKEKTEEAQEGAQEEQVVIVIKEGEMLKVRPGQPPPPLKVSKVNLKKVKRWWEDKEAKKPKEERGDRQD